MASTEKIASAAVEKAPTIWHNLKKNTSRGLVLLGASALASSAAVAWLRYQAAKADRLLPDEFVLEVDLQRISLVERASADPLALLRGEGLGQVELSKVLKALKAAERDDRVRGVLTLVGPREHLGGMGMVQELRSALLDFRSAAGARAPTIAFSAAFGEAGMNGTLSYYLASACSKVYMQPTGMLGFSGMESTVVFVKGLLDKLKVRPHFFRREEYKSFANQFTESGFTAPHRENMQTLLQGLSSQVVEGVAASRGLPLDKVRQALDAAPLLPRPALDLGLVDGLKYRDEVYEMFPKSDKLMQADQAKAARAATPAGKVVRRRMRRVPVTKYIMLQEMKEAAAQQSATEGVVGSTPWGGLAQLWSQRTREDDAKEAGPQGAGGKPKVAVVNAVGAIVQGPVMPGAAPPTGQVIDATRLSAELAKLEEDPQVRAVVLRISSPGGSALGSDTLHRALTRLKAAGKTLVVSMGDVAASGGMYIAAAADHIVAQPATLTGSIGVITGKVNVGPLLQEYGLNPESITVGANVDMLSPFKDLSPQQVSQVEGMMDHIYLDFCSKVAVSRGKTLSEVRGIAKGRVYTGAQAQEVGLVDQLGGLAAAVEAAKRRAQLPEEPDKVVVFEHPPKKVPFLLRVIRSSGMVPEGGDEGAASTTSLGTSTGTGSGQQLAELLLQASGLPAGSAVAAAAAAAAGGAGTGAGVGGGPAMLASALSATAGGRRLLSVLSGVLTQLAVVEGGVCMYSLEADVLTKV